jgi:serine/threonine-protein kinase RsbW
MEKELKIINDIDEISALATEIERLGEQWKLSGAMVTNINLVIEEAVSNIIFYAFDDQKTHEIKIWLSLNNKLLTVIIIDDGKPFDPTKTKVPDIDLPAQDREVGGLGIFLIGKIMDSFTYQRNDNNNILTLKKTVE